MNRNRILCTFVAIACLGLAWKPSMQPASAATFMWNVSSGTWDTSSTNWSGATGPTLWDSVTGGTNTADFTASGATATIGTGAAVYTNGIIFDSPAWITGGTMHLAGTTPAITVNATGGTIASVLAGTGGLVENGTGVLTLTASNFYSGTTAINGGTIAVSNVGALGTSSVALAGGAMLNVNFISATPTLTNPISVAAGQSGFFNVIGSGAAGNNTVTIAGSAALNINGDLLVSRNAGSPGATNFSDLITGSGTLEVGNTNAGIAPMAVSGSQGRCTFTNSGAFTNFTGTIHVDNGANLLFNPSPANQLTTTQTLTIDSGGYATVLGGTTTAFGALNGSGTVTTNAASTIATLSIGNSGGSGTFTGVIAQNVLLGTAPVSLLKNGAGLEVLAGPSSYTRGTTISGGTLQIGAGGTTGSLSNSTTSVNTLTDNATLTFNRSDTITQGTQFSPNGITGNGSLVQLGPGTLVLNAANTYMGNTTVSGGTLQIGNGGSLNTAGLIAVSSGATLAFNRSDTPTQGTDFSSSGIGGAGGLAQIGTGTLILNASNTYSGPTTVSAGALQVDGTIAQTSAISVSTAGTLAGAGLIGGNSSPTTLTGGATVNLSGGTIGGPLNVTGGNWTGTGTVNGLVTASSNVFAVANGSSLTTASNMNLSGGTLTGQGTISGGTLTLGNGAVIAPGNTANTNNVGTLTLPSLFTSGGGTLNLDLSSTTTPGSGVNDLIQVAGNMSLGGTTLLAIYPTAGSLATGTPYTLFTYGGNLSHSGVLAIVPGSISSRETAAFNYGSGNNSAVTMTISGFIANLTWIGTSSTTWVNNTSAKPWTSPTSPSGDFFASGDFVTFDNNAVTTSVSLSGSLLPGSITVTGSNNFTFSGAGVIGGVTGLALAGPGSLTIANTGNYYSGATLVQGGTLVAGANNALSSASALILGSNTGNGTVDLAGFSQAVASLGTDPSAVAANQTIGNSAASTTATLTINSSSTYGGMIQDGLNGAGGQTALTVAGGLVNLGGSNTYSGPTTINSAGTLQLGSNTALGAGANAGNLVANGLLDLQGNQATVGAISGSGTVADSSLGFATLNFGTAANSTFSGVFQSLNLAKTGAGTFVLTGANSASSTTINQGTFQIGNNVLNGTAGTATQYIIAPGARLYFNQGANPATTFSWGNFSGGGTIELNDALTVSTSFVQYSSLWSNPGTTNALSNFTGTFQLDHRGFVYVDSAGLGGTTNVVVNQGAQMGFNDGYSTANTFSQNFSIAGMGSLTNLNYGALANLGMNVNITGNITLTGDSGLYMNNANNTEMMNVSGSISDSGSNYGLTIYDANSNPIILSGANTYTGTTSVASGTLAVNGSLAPSGSVTVAAGTGLTGAGSVGATTVNAGGNVLGGYNNAGSLTLASLAFAGSANVYGALGNSTMSPAPIIVNGALTTSAGTILVNLTGTMPTVSGTYPFLQYSTLGGSGTAAFQMATPSRAYTLTNVTGATDYLAVTYAAGLYPIWTGSNSTAFVGGTNWKLSTDGSPTDYMNLDQVVFDDTATGTTTVNVNQNVTPTSTTFNNSTLSYTLTGAFGIGGAGSLTKNGTAGLLTIANTNSYTGGTFINGGTLAANSIGNSGVASALGAGTAITLNGGALAITNNTAGNSAMATNRAIAIGASGGSMAVVGTSTGGITSNGAISGSNPLVLTGTGLFTVPVYNNAFTGGFVVNGGTLAFGNTNNNVNQSYLGSGPLVVNSGAVAFADNVNSMGYVNPGGTNIWGAVVSSVTLTGGTLVQADNNAVNKGRLPNTTMTGATITGLGLGSNSEFDPADTSGTMTVTVNPSNTTSTISVAILGLLSNVNFDVSQGSTATGVDLLVTSDLNYYNNVSSVTKSGPGEMVLSGTSSYTGGTNVIGGTLIVTNNEGIADGTSLNVGDPSYFTAIAPAAAVHGQSPAAVTAVPEPGTLLLLLAAVASAAACLRGRRRRADEVIQAC